MQKHLFALCLACSLLCSAAQADTLDDIIGVAKKYRSIKRGLIGTTEVTPAYTLKYWYKSEFGYYHNHYFKDIWVVTRDVVSGGLRYVRKSTKLSGSFVTSQDSFPVNELRRLNFRCDLSYVDWDGYVDRTEISCLREFSVAVWASKIVKTGFFPPGEPYRICLKSNANLLADNCDAVPTFSRDVRAKTSINDSGYSVVKFGLVNYDYAWPMLCWAGNLYDY